LNWPITTTTAACWVIMSLSAARPGLAILAGEYGSIKQQILV
jgi:hypothetical protein